MSGAEIVPIVFAGISAATGLYSAYSDSKHKKPNSQAGALQQTTKTTQITVGSPGNSSSMFAFSTASAEARATKSGCSATSTHGGSAVAGTGIVLIP